MKIAVSMDKFQTSTRQGFGLEIRSEHGVICVLSNSPYSPAKHSITEFVVNEDSRSKGYGKELLKEAIRRFGDDLGGQASSDKSVTMMYALGFRMANNPDGTVQNALAARRQDSSVYLRLQKR